MAARWRRPRLPSTPQPLRSRSSCTGGRLPFQRRAPPSAASSYAARLKERASSRRPDCPGPDRIRGRAHTTEGTTEYSARAQDPPVVGRCVGSCVDWVGFRAESVDAHPGTSRGLSRIYRPDVGLPTGLKPPDKREVGSSTLPRPIFRNDCPAWCLMPSGVFQNPKKLSIGL